MAETVVNYVLGKLCDVELEEVAFSCGVGDEVESVKRELNRIRCFLRDADRKRGKDELVRNWVNDLKNVSFQIEDTIDTFLIEVGRSSWKGSGVWGKITKTITGPKRLVASYKFKKEIDKILARIQEITKARETYGIKNLGGTTGSGVSVPAKQPILSDLDEVELVGFQVDVEKNIGELLDESISRCCVVSIIGPSGIGKTTVAQRAYSSNAVKSHFEVRMWLSISQEFKLIDLLRKMLLRFRSIEDKEKHLGEEHFMSELNKYLRDKKYLIVLDDVWSTDLWDQIVTFLPDVKNGSRVIITSRFSNIAKAADPMSYPYELPRLYDEESLQLLLKIALPNIDAYKGCPTDILCVAHQLAKTCDGLPLALTVLGGLLSVKSPTCVVWEKVLETMVQAVDGKKNMHILSSTYDDMPYFLKSCFMYLACFPMDYEINARHLIRLWVAEGLILQEHSKTLEDTAEMYLKELVQRYMVTVIERYCDNSIKTIRVHDLLRDLAINKAKKDNLITVFSKNTVDGSGDTIPRRVALQFSSCHQLKKLTGSNLRSLHCFGNQVPDYSRYEMLRVFNMEGNRLHYREYNEMELERSTWLRFFRVARDCNAQWVSDYRQIYLNPSVGRLKNLQTLDLKWAILEGGLPESVWRIKTLRHVFLPLEEEICGPPSWVQLENLQTLGYVDDLVSWQTQLPHFPNVRRLKLLQRFSLETIASLFQTLAQLISLYLRFDDRYSALLGIVDMRDFPFYQNLQTLHLYGKWPDNLDLKTRMLPPNLIKLRLRDSELKKDPMPKLEKLQCLKILILDRTYSGEEMICSAGGFPCLEQLELSRLENLKKFEIEEGAMSTLKLLEIKHCEYLGSLPKHLTCRIEREKS